MDIFQAIILGIIEGITEFLPISSTGHLLIAQNMIGYKDTAEIFTVVVQLGALGAVVWFYRQDLWEKITSLINGNKVQQKFLLFWFIATIPASIFGFLLSKTLPYIDSPRVIAVTLILGGLLIWLIENHFDSAPVTKQPKLNKINLKQSILIGFSQVLALIPGVSRSGATIMGGLLTGLDRVTATTFSFYLSIPIILMAGLYKLISSNGNLTSVSGGGIALIMGTLSAFVTSFIVIKWLLKYVSKHDFKIFAYYRIVLGIVILIMLITG